MKERYIEADDERWFVKLGEFPPHPGVGTVIFFPRNTQRPYRVVEVAENRFASQEALDKLSDNDLLQLFHHGDMMDYSHDAHAGPSHDAEVAQRLPSDVGTGES